MSDPVTPNMGLTKPVVLGTPGPTYATEINGNADLIDQHTHAPGFGVQVPTAGINLNADLPFNGNNGIGVRSVRLNSQAISPVAPDLRAVYANGNDLWFNDGVGNAIQLTAAGAVNVGSVGSITGMGGTTATVVYSNISKTFTFSQAANTAAKMDTGDIAIRDTTVVSGNAATLKVPAGLASSYTMVLPGSAPAGILVSSGGAPANLSFGSVADGTTTSQSGSTLSVAASGVGTTQLANAAVTNAKLANGNIVRAATGSGAFTTTSSTAVLITNQTLPSITVTGNRPILIGFASDGTSTSSFGAATSTGTQAVVTVQFSSDGGSTFFYSQQYETFATATFNRLSIPPGSLTANVTLSAGSYTIGAYIKVAGSGGGTFTALVTNVKAFAYEL